MSLLNFLRIIEEIQPVRGKRRLALESLERRGVLAALEDLPVIEPVPLPLPEAQPVLEVPPPEDALPPLENGPPGNFDPDPTNGDNPPPPASVPPVITSTGTQHDLGWVWFTGTVSDADGPVEGFRHVTKPIFSVQYHPEASPGPHDADYLFQQFLESMESK